MKEIEKLKIEHARYRKALELLVSMYDEPHAKAALNPPAPPPVTLEELISALKKFNIERGQRGQFSIVFFADESGTISLCKSDIFTFYSFQEAYDFLNT